MKGAVFEKFKDRGCVSQVRPLQGAQPGVHRGRADHRRELAASYARYAAGAGIIFTLSDPVLLLP